MLVFIFGRFYVEEGSGQNQSRSVKPLIPEDRLRKINNPKRDFRSDLSDIIESAERRELDSEFQSL